MPDDELAPTELKEEKEEATLDQDDLESENEQTWEDEYEDTGGQTTAPLHHGPGVTIQRYRCRTCGHTAERPVTGTAYDDLPPVHHNQYMTAVSEEEARLPLEEFLERALRKAAKAAKGKAARRQAKPRPRPKKAAGRKRRR
jgi:hypothetical protein